MTAELLPLEAVALLDMEPVPVRLGDGDLSFFVTVDISCLQEGNAYSLGITVFNVNWELRLIFRLLR
jgi:hypothetical protein